MFIDLSQIPTLATPCSPPTAKMLPPMLPPTVGGSSPIFRMSSKSLLKHKVFGPKYGKILKIFACGVLPPCVGGSFAGEWLPLKGSGVGGRLPPKTGATPL